MKVKWLGHASFLVTSDKGVRIITDPYTPGGNIMYGAITEPADVVTISHEHGDHNNGAGVKGNPKILKESGEVKGIKFTGIPANHDDAGGTKRGKDTIFCFEVDGMRLCHLGDLGHQLSREQAAAIGKVDVLFIPVGGLYTIDGAGATRVVDQIKPKIVFPMHYKTAKCGYPISAADDFLKDKKDVKKLDANEVELKAGKLPSATQVIVLKPAM